MSVSTDPDNEFAYAAEVVKCHACAATAKVVRKYVSNKDNDDAGLMARIVRAPS